MRLLRCLTESPYLNMAVGLILILVSGDEVIESLRDGFDQADLNVNLSATLVGVVQMLKALPDLVEGMEYLERARMKE